MQPKTIKQTLICELTETERREYGIALATKLGDMEEIEAEKKKNADHFKDRIAGLQASCDELSRKVRDGKEWREVVCEVTLGAPDKAHKQVVRMDTCEVVKTERMTEAELQMVMPLDVFKDAMDPGDRLTVSVGGQLASEFEKPVAEEQEETADTEDAPENIELLESLAAAKSVAKRHEIIEGYMQLFGREALPVVIELAKHTGFDVKKLAELESCVVTPEPVADY